MTAEHLYVLLGIGAVLIAFLGWLFKRAIPKTRDFFRRLNGTLDAIGGREAYIDPASGRKVERLLPLTTRMATVEEAIIQLAENRMLTHQLSKRVAHVESRVDSLEKAAIDRVATKVENAAAMSLFERLHTAADDVIDSDGTELDEETP